MHGNFRWIITCDYQIIKLGEKMTTFTRSPLWVAVSALNALRCRSVKLMSSNSHHIPPYQIEVCFYRIWILCNLTRVYWNSCIPHFIKKIITSVYPALPVSFGGDTKSHRSLLSGVYASGSKRSVDSTTHCKKNSPPPECDYAAENAAVHLYRKKKRK